MDRQQIFSNLRTNPNLDVLIIGAGINGAGTFRDLALNGVNVLLIDRGDFCSGASAASSHMAHGGIRYLENGEFRLVREAVQERNRMIQNAPHLVQPLPTTIPIFKFWSGLFNAPLKFLGLLNSPSERGAVIIKIGLLLYDAFTKQQGTVPGHSFFGKSDTLSKFPQMNPAVRFSATYFDGSIISPERYTVELILDAENEGNHACALNYAIAEKNGLGNLTLKDKQTGQSYQISPKVIINAAGPWIDFVNTSFGISHQYIGGTKGSHIVVDHRELRDAIGENEIFFENEDGRIVLIFPLADKVLIGTTDIPVQDPDGVNCEHSEIEYFKEMIVRVFPSIQISEDQIIFRFSGVRPLESQHTRTTSQITRDHSIKTDQLNNIPVFSMVGGKWTTYRAFAEQITDIVLKQLGIKRIKNTWNLKIGGGKDYIPQNRSMSDHSNWLSLYGSRRSEIENYLSRVNHQLVHAPFLTRNEIAYLIQVEKVVHLDDLVLRRTMLAYFGKLTKPLLQELAELTAEILSWNDHRLQEELDHLNWILDQKHGIRLSD